MEKTLNKKINMRKLTIIIVAIILTVTIVFTIAIGALVGVGALCTTIFLIGEYNSYHDREFKAPINGAFEVTDVVELEFEGYGTVKIELYGKEAPKTVASFLAHVEAGDFCESELLFSRSSIDKKMTVNFPHDHEENNLPHEITGEFYDNGITNRISHIAGVLTAPRNNAYTSSTNGFMIILNDHTGETNETNETTGSTTKIGYDGHYAAFGKVTDGTLSVIEKMMADYKETASSSSSSTAKPENELLFGTNRITLNKTDIQNGAVEYKFTPKATGKYTFRSSTFESILISKADGSVIDDENSLLGTLQTNDVLRSGIEYELENGVEYKVVLGIRDLAVGTKLLTISGDILFTGTNKIDLSEQDVAFNDAHYEFTPDKTGLYNFEGKDDIKNKIEIFDGESSVGTKNAYLEAGKTYTVIINTIEDYNIVVEADTYELTITPPIIVSGENKLDVPVVDVLRFGKAIYYFTPSSDGKYLFKDDNGLTILVYDENDNKLEGDSYELEKGKTYKIILKPDFSSVLFVGYNSISTTNSNDGASLFTGEYDFFAEGKGDYTFIAPSDVSVEVYNGTTKLQSINGNNTYYLTAGKAYKIKLISPTEVKDQAFMVTAELYGANKYTLNFEITVTVQDTKLLIGTNDKTITKSEVDNKTTEFTFTATTNGIVSITGTFPVLENGEHLKNEAGQLRYKNARITVIDENGNEHDNKHVVLIKGETYRVILKTENITPGSSCEFKIQKVAPRITNARVLK